MLKQLSAAHAAGELERAEKRLATLAGVRPPYMDEYEALTGQLQVRHAKFGSRGLPHADMMLWQLQDSSKLCSRSAVV
jgi:hypothetical protein